MAEAKKQGETPTVALPQPENLKDVAAKAGMNHEITPLLTREQAEQYGQVSGAEVGLSRLSGGRRFAAEFFDTKSGLYEPVELTDPQGTRFLVRKIADLPSRIPPLEEVRPQVVQAWKLEQARRLAEKAAQEFAETVRSNGGVIKDDQVKDRSVIITEPVTRLQPGAPLPGQFFASGPPTETEIRQIPNAGEALRNALFDLTPEVGGRRPQSAEDDLLRPDPGSPRTRLVRRPVRPQRRLHALPEREHGRGPATSR